MQVSTIGLDIAKNVFQVHGIDSEGHAVLCRKVRRHRLLPCGLGGAGSERSPAAGDSRDRERGAERSVGGFWKLYTNFGRPSIAPERLLRAMLLQAFYGVRSERQLMERMEFDLLFRWFVGLGVDDPVWDHSTFSKNRDRLLEGAIAGKFLAAVLAQPQVKRLLSSEHFSVYGTLVEAWASIKSFRRTDGSDDDSQGPGRNGGVPTRRTKAPPIPRRGFTGRLTDSRPSSGIWGMPGWRITTAWRSTAV